MTINKVQGQTLDLVGVFLRESKMNLQYKLLREITPTTRGWIAKLTVIEKLIPRISRNGVLYQRIILADIETLLQILQPKTLTMWDELTETVGKTICEILPQNPIIIGTRLKVVSHNGISLSSKQQSSFIINLTNIPQINELRQWSINNEEYLSAIINEKRLFPSQTALRTLQYNNIITINDIQNLPQEQTTFRINASISIKNLRQPFWYMACTKCRQKADLDNKTSCFNCYSCNELSVETIPRCHFQAQLTDHTGSLIAMFFGENAEKILNCTAEELIHM
ncbi:hypothetical protein CsatA_000476 [Cannabis sativa]